MAHKRYKLGRCYENAWRWAIDNQHLYKSMRIVHGFPRLHGYGQLYGHAWVEWRGWCYEPAKGEKVCKSMFYLLNGIDAKLCRRYTLKEAAKQLIKAFRYGPWHESPQGTLYRENFKELYRPELYSA